MASGTGAQIAVTKTGSLTDPASTDSVWEWTNFVGEGLEHSLEELEEGAITGRRDAPPSHKGIDMGEGEITLEPNPNALGHFMNGVFGISSGELLCDPGSTGANSGPFAGAQVLKHTFTPRQTAHDDRTFLEPYGVFVYKDVGSGFLFNGAIFPSMTFRIEGNQLVGATVNVMARDVTRMARTAAISSLVSSGGRPWIWDQASIQIGPGVNSLAVNAKFESVEIGLETPHEGVILLDGTKKYAEYQPNDFRRVSINGTMTFRDHAEYDDFVNYENAYLRVNLTQVVSDALLLGNPSSAFWYELQFDIPLMKYLSWSTPVGGPNRLQTQITAKGEYDVSRGYMIQAQLTSIASVY